MTATRAMKIGLVLFFLCLAAVITLFMGGFISRSFVDDALFGMRHFLITAGIPVGAVLLSEIPIRDGMTHRTLLYPLLGPVPRTTLAVVRIVTTGGVLFIGSGFLLLLIRLMLRDDLSFMGRELLAVFLGSFAYVALFGLVHLFNRRGLITSLVILFLFDIPLGKIPFSLRNISPSYHMGVLADQEETLRLPVAFGYPDVSLVISSLVLLGIAVFFSAAVAYAFKRKNLGELC
jgi:hypothetical protein